MKKLLMLAVVLMLAIRAVAKQGNVQSDANTAHTAGAMDNTGDTPTSKVTKQRRAITRRKVVTQGGSSYTPDEVRTTRGKKGMLRAGASAPPALYSLPLSFREEPF
jgi:hypothetical protein